MVELSGVIDMLTSWGIFVGALIFVIVVMGAVFYFYYYNYLRYKQYKVVVTKKDAFGNIDGTIDWGAVFEQGKYKRLWLRKNKISLSADAIPYMTINKQKYVFLHKKGSKNYVFVQPVISDDGLTFSVGEEDVNWALIMLDQTNKSFSQSWLIQYAPYMLVLFSIMVVMVIFVMLINKIDAMVEISKNLGGAFARNVV